ncbi:MAG: GNAT family N-acetyltransferase [Desulfobulbaceae bacterium]|nr:GNAT family N-acetyltransferase [Desulfobulbaceae bacterium]
MKIDEHLFKFLQWDTSFFGYRIGSLVPHRLTPLIVKQLIEWRRLNDIACVYIFADPNDPSTIRLSEEARFQLVDIQSVYEFDIVNNPLPVKEPLAELSIRPHKLSDIANLAAIARTSHGNTRFYNDSHFSKQQADSFYDKWIENSCGGWADRVYVAEFKGEIVGYITCHIDNVKKNGKIGLLGVKSSIRSRGIGQCLLYNALQWQKSKDMSLITITTQAANIAAQRVYQRLGFITSSTSLVYHAWSM